MSRSIIAYRVLIELTDGLEAERRAFADAVHAFNDEHALARGAMFVPVAWDDATAPREELLADDLATIDYFVPVLWDRWPPGGRGELDRAFELLADPDAALRRVVPFFKAVAARRTDDPGDRLQEVLELRGRLESTGELRVETFEDLDGFRTRLRRHLRDWLAAHDRESTTPAADDIRSQHGLRPATRSARGSPEPGPPPRDPAPEPDAPDGDGDEPAIPVSLDDDEAARRSWQPHPLEDNADALNEYGLFLQREGYAGEAEAMHRQALDLAREQGPPEAVAVALGHLGVILLRRRELDLAEELLLEALDQCTRLDRQRGVAAAYAALGLVYRGRDELERAEEMFRNALRVEKELGRPEGMVAAYGQLGLLYDFRGQPDRAEEMRRLARAISEEPEYPRGDLFPGRI